MRKLSFIVGLGLLFAGCSSNEHDLKIPDTVAVTKNANEQQFPGTRVLMEVPKGYELSRQFVRFQKDSNTYIQVLESPGTDFYDRKPAVMSGFDAAVKSGKISKEYYKKEFKLGAYDALLYYAADDQPNQEQIVLFFGDKQFAVMASGEIPAGNKEAREEVLHALLSMNVDTATKADVTSLAGYTVDVANTEFAYNGNAGQAFFYTIGGKGDPVNNPFEDQITVSTLPAMTNEAKMLYAQKLLERYKSRMNVTDVAEKEVNLNGNYAYEISFKSEYQGKKSTAYQLVTGDDKITLLLVGSIYNRPEVLMPQVKQIAQTLRVK
ncbi:hypothetical protein [Taibaiella soli]|uniref:Uncharacterized protein n=1 Tax=Taibaiella soli TaxID=1649169 RepID=A0A2W2C2H5_9BACT|nr:hypothetical protein [Taibaiella soli]PZF74293.1 hypothetical protein DN068_04600 [Taibaiella soli]